MKSGRLSLSPKNEFPRTWTTIPIICTALVNENEQWFDLWFGAWTWISDPYTYKRSIVLEEQPVVTSIFETCGVSAHNQV